MCTYKQAIIYSFPCAFFDRCLCWTLISHLRSFVTLSRISMLEQQRTSSSKCYFIDETTRGGGKGAPFNHESTQNAPWFPTSPLCFFFFLKHFHLLCTETLLHYTSASPRAQHVMSILPLGPFHRRPPGHPLQHTSRPLHPRQPHAHPQFLGLHIWNPRRQHGRCLVRLPRRKSMSYDALLVRSYFIHCCILPCGLCRDVCPGFR